MSRNSVIVVNYLMLTIKGLSKNSQLWLCDKLELPVVSRHLTPKPAKCGKIEAMHTPSIAYIIVTMPTSLNSVNLYHKEFPAPKNVAYDFLSASLSQRGQGRGTLGEEH